MIRRLALSRHARQPYQPWGFLPGVSSVFQQSGLGFGSSSCNGFAASAIATSSWNGFGASWNGFGASWNGFGASAIATSIATSSWNFSF
jgi:hypothetical protein